MSTVGCSTPCLSDGSDVISCAVAEPRKRQCMYIRKTGIVLEFVSDAKRTMTMLHKMPNRLVKLIIVKQTENADKFNEFCGRSSKIVDSKKMKERKTVAAYEILSPESWGIKHENKFEKAMSIKGMKTCRLMKSDLRRK